MPTRKGFVAHLHDLDTKFQRLDEGQQCHGQQLRDSLTRRSSSSDLERKVERGISTPRSEKLRHSPSPIKIELGTPTHKRPNPMPSAPIIQNQLRNNSGSDSLCVKIES